MKNQDSSPENSMSSSESDSVSARIAAAAIEAKRADYEDEVRRLLDAARAVMRRKGTSAKSRVADIVEEAGLSNDAFYRHFKSKDALIEAILEDGGIRLRTYLAHQMAKEDSPAEQVRRWVEGVLHQGIEPEAAETTVAVLFNAGSAAGQRGASPASAPLASLLVDPLAALGADDPAFVAALVGHAVVGRLGDHLWGDTTPTDAEVDAAVAFALRAAG